MLGHTAVTKISVFWKKKCYSLLTIRIHCVRTGYSSVLYPHSGALSKRGNKRSGGSRICTQISYFHWQPVGKNWTHYSTQLTRGQEEQSHHKPKGRGQKEHSKQHTWSLHHGQCTLRFLRLSFISPCFYTSGKYCWTVWTVGRCIDGYYLSSWLIKKHILNDGMR